MEYMIRCVCKLIVDIYMREISLDTHNFCWKLLSGRMQMCKHSWSTYTECEFPEWGTSISIPKKKVRFRTEFFNRLMRRIVWAPRATASGQGRSARSKGFRVSESFLAFSQKRASAVPTTSRERQRVRCAAPPYALSYNTTQDILIDICNALISHKYWQNLCVERWWKLCRNVRFLCRCVSDYM